MQPKATTKACVCACCGLLLLKGVAGVAAKQPSLGKIDGSHGRISHLHNAARSIAHFEEKQH